MDFAALYTAQAITFHMRMGVPKECFSGVVYEMDAILSYAVKQPTL